MLLRKQELSQDAAVAFGLARDPFQADVQEAADVYLSPQIRYVREQLWAVSRHGGMLAVIGESGAGKSTLAHLLMRLMAPASGRILIDGVDIASLTLTSLRSQIGVVLAAAIRLVHQRCKPPSSRGAPRNRNA